MTSISGLNTSRPLTLRRRQRRSDPMDQVPRGTWSVTNQTAFASVLFPPVSMISCTVRGIISWTSGSLSNEAPHLRDGPSASKSLATLLGKGRARRNRGRSRQRVRRQGATDRGYGTGLRGRRCCRPKKSWRLRLRGQAGDARTVPTALSARPCVSARPLRARSDRFAQDRWHASIVTKPWRQHARVTKRSGAFGFFR
jgi:hypothetical protein